MINQTKENADSLEASQDLLKVRKPKKARPNIDHLIKRIVVERKNQERKNILVFVVILSIAMAAGISIYN
tara:strand:+ start:589 stop:798 length:210 start_codon:yes stop_codon:yes gene_type:complete